MSKKKHSAPDFKVRDRVLVRFNERWAPGRILAENRELNSFKVLIAGQRAAWVHRNLVKRATEMMAELVMERLR